MTLLNHRLLCSVCGRIVDTHFPRRARARPRAAVHYAASGLRCEGSKKAAELAEESAP